MDPRPAPVTVTIIGGFLGAGKTTLLNHVLSSEAIGHDGRRVGVIVNDFGSINIDAKLVVGVDGDTIDLANGCVCCSLRDDFMVALQRLLARPTPPDHIIIEASGVSDPAAIARGFDEPGLADLLCLDAVLVVVDAEHHQRLRTADHIVAAGQLRTADVVVLNKVDLVDEAQLESLEANIRKMVPLARIYRTSFGRIGPELFFGAVPEHEVNQVERLEGESDHSHEHSHPHSHAHDHVHPEFETFRFVSERPLSSRRLRRVIESLPPHIYRAKGIVRLIRDRGRRAVLHVVGRRAELQLGDPWGNEAPRSELVFIGTRGSLNPAELNARLESCIGTDDGPGVFGWFRRLWFA